MRVRVLLAVLVLAGCADRKLGEREIPGVSCRLTASRTAVDLTCAATSRVKLTSVKRAFWVFGDGDAVELLTSPQEFGPDGSWRMPVLVSTSGRLNLSDVGECTHGIEVSLEVDGRAHSFAFEKFREACETR